MAAARDKKDAAERAFDLGFAVGDYASQGALVDILEDEEAEPPRARQLQLLPAIATIMREFGWDYHPESGQSLESLEFGGLIESLRPDERRAFSLGRNLAKRVTLTLLLHSPATRNATQEQNNVLFVAMNKMADETEELARELGLTQFNVATEFFERWRQKDPIESVSQFIDETDNLKDRIHQDIANRS